VVDARVGEQLRRLLVGDLGNEVGERCQLRQRVGDAVERELDDLLRHVAARLLGALLDAAAHLPGGVARLGRGWPLPGV
jgi:hypothetical protein